jgi:hypothetical protein
MSVATISKLSNVQVAGKAISVPYHTNVGFPFPNDLQTLVDLTVQRLVQQAAPLLSPTADVSLDPLFPLADIGAANSPTKYTDAVVANNYKDDWTITQQFTAPATSGSVTAFAFRTKADGMALGIGAVLLDSTAVKAIRHIHFYRQMSQTKLVYTADVGGAMSLQNYPYYYVPLGTTIIVKPGEELAVVAVFSESYLTSTTASASSTAPVTIQFKMQMLPSVKLVAKVNSAYSLT